MANPITSIINPREDRVLVFQITPQQQLALSQTPLAASLRQLSYSANGTPKGNHATNQSIDSIYLRGLPTVWGKALVVKVIVDPNDESKTIQQKSYVLSQLSPITNLLAPADDQERITTDMPGFAATSDKEDTAWFYYLRKMSPESKPELWQATLEFDSVSFTKLSNIPSEAMPGESSRLAAVYQPDKKERLVFFQKKQDKDNKIYYVTPGSNNQPQPIPDTQSALDGTSIAAVITPEGVIHLYWTTAQSDLKRSTLMSPRENWSTVSPQISALRLQPESQITATHIVTGSTKENYVWYIEEGADKYSKHTDSIH